MFFGEGWKQCVIDALFPFFCVACGKEGEIWCESCRPAMTNLQSCGDGKSFFAVSYEESSAVVKALLACKYHGVEELGFLVGAWVGGAILNEERLRHRLLVPVPLHPRRMAERGFNQSESIARGIASVTGQCVERGISRVRYTGQQARLSKEKRVTNVENAFVASGVILGSKSLLVVDDVYTTGSTMHECVSACGDIGVKDVLCFAVAHDW